MARFSKKILHQDRSATSELPLGSAAGRGSSPFTHAVRTAEPPREATLPDRRGRPLSPSAQSARAEPLAVDAAAVHHAVDPKEWGSAAVQNAARGSSHLGGR
jgi:hypothetical protein